MELSNTLKTKTITIALIFANTMSHALFLHEILKLKSIAETGLIYCKNEYDIERYKELQEISYKLLAEFSGQEPDDVKFLLPQAVDYPTAKVDIRGIVLSEDKKILLVQESLDGKWSLPGGWGDIGYSPKETIVKEFKEETGLQIVPERLLAVFDKKMHAHPPQPFYVYKFAFYCKAVTTDIIKGFDVLDIQFFDINDLPVLSEDRILKSQIDLIYKKIITGDITVHVD